MDEKCGVCGREISIADEAADKCRACGATLSCQCRLIEPYPGAMKSVPPSMAEIAGE
jgi:hypothetical protein